jgi:signal peptidase I
MKKYIINPQLIVKFKQISVVFVSLFLPGIGHVYCGEWARGFFFVSAISLFAFLMPFGLITKPEQLSLQHALFMFLLCIGTYIASQIGTMRLIFKNNSKFATSSVRASKLLAFALLSFLLTASSIFCVSLFYSFEKIPDDSMQPTFFQGEILLLASKTAIRLMPGDVIVYQTNASKRIGRIIAKEHDTINTADGLMEVNGTPLSMGIVLADEIARRDLESGEELFYEVTATRKYPLRIATLNKQRRFTEPASNVPDGHFAIAFDNRLSANKTHYVNSSSTIGRVEGVIRGKTLKRFRIPPYETL